MQASEEKVDTETRPACLLPFTSCGRSLVSEDWAISTFPGEALPGGMVGQSEATRPAGPAGCPAQR